MASERVEIARREDRLDRQTEEVEARSRQIAAGELALALTPKSGWYDKKKIAAYFDCSVSWIEKRMVEGMPHAKIGRNVRFKPRGCEPWLEQHDHLVRKGGS